MTQTSSPTSPLGRLWKTLTSLRLTLVLLIMLALVSLVGTVRVEVFGTLWFLAPLGLLVLNLTACLIRGLPQALHRSRLRLTPEAALELPERARFAWPHKPAPRGPRPRPCPAPPCASLLKQPWSCRNGPASPGRKTAPPTPGWKGPYDG